MNARVGNDCPPAVDAAEGRSIAVGANAGAAYRADEAAGKRPVRAGEPRGRAKPSRAAFRAPTGRIWRYSGKRARVLVMLANEAGGVTQWDTLPWHTRLGATVHALRRDGLVIDTEREGEFRHARYRLCTPGRLIIQAENSEGPVILHRETP